MISRDEIHRIAEEVKENQQRLDSCDLHDFDMTITDKPLTQKFRCRKCGGEVRGPSLHWYLKGLAHGRANPV